MGTSTVGLGVFPRTCRTRLKVKMHCKKSFPFCGVEIWNCENIIKTKLSWSAVLVCTYIRVWHPSDSSGFRMIQVFHGTGQWKGNLGHSSNVLWKKNKILHLSKLLEACVTSTILRPRKGWCWRKGDTKMWLMRWRRIIPEGTEKLITMVRNKAHHNLV